VSEYLLTKHLDCDTIPVLVKIRNDDSDLTCANNNFFGRYCYGSKKLSDNQSGGRNGGIGISDSERAKPHFHIIG